MISLILKKCGIAVLSVAPACAPQHESKAPQFAPVQKEIAMSSAPKLDGNTARDGQIAIREEFDAAMAQNSAAALKLFIARHPTSPWTAQAQARLNAVKNGTYKKK